MEQIYLHSLIYKNTSIWMHFIEKVTMTEVENAVRSMKLAVVTGVRSCNGTYTGEWAGWD